MYMYILYYIYIVYTYDLDPLFLPFSRRNEDAAGGQRSAHVAGTQRNIQIYKIHKIYEFYKIGIMKT